VTSTDSAERVATFLRENKLRLHYILETHAHGDHLTSSQWFRRRFEAKIVIGARIKEIQARFNEIFDATFQTDGGQFDRLVEDGHVLTAGAMEVAAIATPGHTPACMTYKIDDALFTGDALFMEDYGVGRCDFPGGSAEELYTSVHDKLYGLADATRVFVGHDYQPGGRSVAYETTIGRSRHSNVQLRQTTSRAEFVEARRARDLTLGVPRLFWASLQVNVDAGRLPAVRGNGRRYFVLPVDLARPTANDGTPLK
jgi:glyoxylase-like metal-dependent hydrolase (beta-lactamase superfamily II)